MKVRIILTPGAQQPATNQLLDYLHRKFGITASAEILSVTQVMTVYKGLNTDFPEDSSADATPLLALYGKGCDWLICLSPQTDLLSVTGYDPLSKTILTAAPSTDFYRIASHEDYHGFWGYLSSIGIPSQDTMDVRLADENYSHEHDIENISGNRERNLNAMQPYLPQLRSRYNTPTFLGFDSAKLIDSLKWYLNYLTTKKTSLAPTAHGRDGLVSYFGNPLAPFFEAQNIVSFNLPYPLYYAGQKVTTARAHRLAVPNFVQALTALRERGLIAQASNYGGIYNLRLKRTNGDLSTHSWGVAIDMEPAKYPLGSTDRMSREVVQCFTEAGFVCGETFPVADPGHFQLVIGY